MTSSPLAPTLDDADPLHGAPLDIAVEATRLARETRGIGRYVRALLPRMLDQRPGTRITLYVKPRDVSSLAALYAERGVPAVRVRPIGRMRSAAADVFWYPWNVTSSPPARGAVVVTMHDIAPLVLRAPRLKGWRAYRRWLARYRRTASRATLILADSSFTADEVRRVLDVPHERLRVALLAADDLTPPSKAHDAAVLADLGLNPPFVLCVGAADGRKNLGLVERAMARVHAARPGVTLALAGPRTSAQASAALREPWMRTLGFVPDEVLTALYRSASCLVMPSTYEGFGLPVLEAMQLGVPVISARTSSLPEVGGDAALWVDPNDDAALADTIIRVVSDRRLAEEMRVAGRAQAARFSWDTTARETLAAFDEAVALGSARTAGPAGGIVRRLTSRLLRPSDLPV